MGKNNRIPLVSVCCMTYNHDKFISQCLDGIIQQKGNFSIEILIHDDASSDHTRQIIEFYRDKYPDIIKPLYQEINQYSRGLIYGTLICFHWLKENILLYVMGMTIG